jgi:hypothetical protein
MPRTPGAGYVSRQLYTQHCSLSLTITCCAVQNPHPTVLKIEQIAITVLAVAAILHFLAYVKTHGNQKVHPLHKDAMDRMLDGRNDEDAEIDYYCALHDRFIENMKGTHGTDGS